MHCISRALATTTWLSTCMVLTSCSNKPLLTEHKQTTQSYDLFNNQLEKQTIMNNNNYFYISSTKNTKLQLKWYSTNVVAQAFADSMAAVWPLARGAYVPVEIDFLKQHPEVVSTEIYFAPFKPLFTQGVDKVDWHAAATTMESVLQKHFIFNPDQLPAHIIEQFSKDECIFVQAQEASTGKIVGFITFLMRQSYTTHTTKVMSFVVDEHYRSQGIGKILMGSIFIIKPTMQRIFLSTRVTNTPAINAYTAWGFTQDTTPIMDHAFTPEHWVFMEYQANKTTILQTIVRNMLTQ